MKKIVTLGLVAMFTLFAISALAADDLPTADVGVAFSVNDPNPVPRSQVIFTLTVINNGPNSASGVKVTNDLSLNFPYVSDNSGGSYNSSTGIWTVGTLTSGQSASILVTVKTSDSNGVFDNTASINACECDPNASNNSVTVQTRVFSSGGGGGGTPSPNPSPSPTPAPMPTPTPTPPPAGGPPSPFGGSVLGISTLEIKDAYFKEISQFYVIINWLTNHPATSRIVFDTVSHPNGEVPNYGYRFSTAENPALVIDHSVVVGGLQPASQYFFRAVSHGSPEVTSNELGAVTKTGTVAGIVIQLPRTGMPADTLLILFALAFLSFRYFIAKEKVLA